MKIIRLVILVCFLAPSVFSAAQGVLEYHAGISVQQLPDGATFRFLQGGSYDDTLTEYSRYYFPGLESGDTVAWQYLSDEDQLYIAAWNPAKAAKKHDVKFAVAWRVTSGNPRYGKVSVPANAKLEGFGGNRAYFSVAGAAGYLPLFFYDKYIPGLAVIEYTLKVGAQVTDAAPKTDYYTIENNFNGTAKQVKNPFGPEATKRKLEREEFVRDSSLSVVLQAIKEKYPATESDPVWGKPHVELKEFSNGLYWRDALRTGRTYILTYIYVEDKYCGNGNLEGTLVSCHPEIIPDKQLSFERFYHENGVTGWKVMCRTFPFLHLELHLALPQYTPALIVGYEADEKAALTNALAFESKYTDNKTIMQMVNATDPYEMGQSIWGRYALDHNIACTAYELKRAFIDMLDSAGYNFDGYEAIGSSSRTDYTGTIYPKYQELKVILISTVEPGGLSLRKGEGYKWQSLEMKEMNGLTGQALRVFQGHGQFPEVLSSYDYTVEPRLFDKDGYVLFFSREAKE